MKTTLLKHLSTVSLTLTLFLAGLRAVQGQRAPDRPEFPNIDQRSNSPTPQSTDREPGLAALHRAVPRVKVDFDGPLGGPSWVSATEGFLTGPAGEGAGISTATLAAIPAKVQHRATRTFLQEHHTLFGFGPDALDKAQTNRDFITPHNGLRTVVWEQRVDDIPLFEGLLISHTTSRGELVSISSHFVPDPEQAANAGTPNRRILQSKPAITAPEAVAFAAKNLGEAVETAEVAAVADAVPGPEMRQHFRAPGLKGESETRLVWLPMSEQAMRLCWEVILTSRARGEMFRILVDAETGKVLLRHGLTAYLTDASYRVYTSDSPSPFSPGYSTPVTTQPPLVSRTLVTLSALNTNASPNGWIDDGVNETIGNNVDAHTDRNADNLPDLPRPHGSPFRVFDFSQDLAQAPSTYTNAAVVQLFYWNNFMHDKLYELGFTEAAGNFQSNNFGRGGLGNDAVQADAQDGGGTDNADFSTPPDGSSGRMQMYIFAGPTPDRDGDLDAEVVLHEYTHGLSNRRVGGGVGISALQPSGMGEGWSDFYGLSLLSEAGDDVNGVYGAGAYASYLLSGLTQNYYFGIRRYPYCTDMSKNPLTFKDIDPAQASAHTGVPRSPVIGSTANEVHNMGEVWCVTLWDARANLINKYGWAVGNQLILQLVTDGMNLSPANPTFLQARDAILQADLVDNGGADLPALWSAFAKRGMGSGATSPASSTTSAVVESYTVPDSLTVSPTTGFSTRGAVGGPFSPASQQFILLNTATNSINWVASQTATWMTLSQTGGTLGTGSSNLVTASLDSSAYTLPAGIYTNFVRFTNLTTSIVQPRNFVLRVGQPDYFTELFDAADNDLDNQTLTFTPDGSANFYSVCREPAFVYPTDPTGSTSLALGSHTYLQLTTPANISIYGLATNVIFLASEGHVTLVAGDSSGSLTLANHFSRPRVSASMAHIHPTENGGKVYWLQLSNRVAITFDKVVEYGTSNTNSFQMELFYDGRIRMTHLFLGTTSGLVGLSAGNGLPTNFIESDLSNYGPCALLLVLTVPHTATEGDAPLSGQINIFSPAPTNVTFALSSLDTSEATVPASVTLLAGQITTNFAIIIVDDALLDGPQTATISASAPGYATGSDTIVVSDNETAALSLTLPAAVTEGAGSVTGTVQASAAPAANIAVSLSSSDTTEVQVPASVILPAGQTSVVFTATIVDDTLIDGDQSAVITAQVPNWTDAQAVVIVHDNEPTNLVVALPATAREGNGILLNAGTVRISGTLPTNLTVALLSSDTTELTVPPTMTITAGQTSGTFSPTVVDDPDIDGPQTVTVTATAFGFSPGATNMVINDDESPPIPFNPSPAHLATNVVQTTGLAWSSGAVPGEIITSGVYFGTSPTLGSAQLQGTTLATNWTLPNLLPLTTYYWQVIARKTGVVPGPVWQFTTRGVDHFAWDAVPSPQYVGQPFSATLTAKDVFGITVSNFVGQVALGGSAGGAGIAAGPTLLVQTSGSLAGSLHAALNNLGKPHDLVQTADLLSLNFSNYSTVILGMDGGSVTYAGMASLATAVNAGAKLLVFGGSSLIGYAAGLNDFFIRVNTNNFVWSTVAGSPHFSVTAPGHLLAAGLPATYNFPNVSTTFYMARVTDSSATTVAVNGDGFGCLVTKPVGQGTVVMFINVGSDSYWTVPADFSLLSTVVSNALVVSGGLPIPLSPSLSGSFTNGTWTGDITAFAPTTNLVLRADDGNGRTGISNPFEVALQNDISVSVVDSPDPVSLGGNLTYGILVTNIGPASATGVLLTNLLPVSARLSSVTLSRGTFTTNGNAVVCNLGSISGNGSATISIVAVPLSVGAITNQSMVSRAEQDNYLTNNAATTVTTVQTPVMSINTVTLYEGNAGSANAVFSVSVSPPPALPVSVSFATANGSATAPADYLSTNGVLNFAPGETNKSIVVSVLGDTLYELNETFNVVLTAPTNAVLANSVGLGTILNDDPMPTLSIGDVTLLEGDTGTTNAVFLVTLSAPSGVNVTANYTTVNGTATAGSDYTSQSGTVTILAGSTNATISISVNGDLAIEPDEVFYVDLSSAANATLLKREGYGLILNDDGLAGQLDHFVWSNLGATQYVGFPFSATLTALDAFNNLATAFTGTANLSASGSGGTGTNSILGNITYSSLSSGTFTLGNSFTPNVNLTVTHVRSYFGMKVSIWTDAGVLLASQSVTGGAGIWTETPLATPITLNAGVTYRVAAYTAGGSYYWRTDGLNTFTNGVINQAYYYSGDGFPTSTDSVRWWFVDLRYTTGAGGSLPITPSITDPFINGTWTGNVTALAPSTNVTVRADDGLGHIGLSAPFAVELRNDISLQITDSPDPVSVGASVTYSLIVTNIGPASANGVAVTNWPPSTASLVSASTSQGTVNTDAGKVVFNLGSIAANTAATATIVVVPTAAGFMTNTVTVYRNEPDALLANNSASAITLVQTPVVSVNSISVAEGNSGLSPAGFTVSLSVPAATNVTVNFATSDGTALAGSDYVATNGILSFAPGQTNQPIVVQIVGDTNGEPNETFSLVLSNPVNAALGAAIGTGTIINDDTGPFFDDFEPTIDLLQWSSFGGTLGTTVIATNYGGSVSGVNSLWFGDAGSRYAVSRSLNTSSGGTVSFYLRLGNSTSPWEMVDLPYEGVVLEASTNNGVSWTLLGGYTNSTFYNWTLVTESIPVTAQSPATQFRWRQLSHSGVGYDHWALDDVGAFLGPQPPQIVTQPSNQVVSLGATASFSVTAAGSSPIYYQWRKDNAPLSGATASAYFIPNVQSNNVGNYSVIVSNLYGAVTSANALLAITVAHSNILAQGDLRISLDLASGGITSVVFQASEIYRVGTFISDWGLQTGTDSSTFVHNANGSSPGLPMTWVSGDNRSVSFAGTYSPGGANVAVTRDYDLLPGANLWRTSMSFRNNGAYSITLRCFETFDVDCLSGGTSIYSTYNDRYLLSTNGTSIQVGRSFMTTVPLVVLLATLDPGGVIAACSSNYFGITSSAYLNSFFLTGGADSGGALQDATLDIGREYVLLPGSNATFMCYQSISTNISTAEGALINNLVNAPLMFGRPMVLPDGTLQLLLGTADGSPITLDRASRIQLCCATNLLSYPTNWIPITTQSVLTNGILRLSGLSGTNSRASFYRALEAP